MNNVVAVCFSLLLIVAVPLVFLRYVSPYSSIQKPYFRTRLLMTVFAGGASAAFGIIFLAWYFSHA